MAATTQNTTTVVMSCVSCTGDLFSRFSAAPESRTPASRVCGFASRFQTSPMPALVTENLIRAGWSAAGTEEAGREAKQAAKVLSDANAKTFLGFLGKQQTIKA